MSVVKLPLETMNKVLSLLGTLQYTQVAELISEVKTNSVVVDEDTSGSDAEVENITTS